MTGNPFAAIEQSTEGGYVLVISTWHAASIAWEDVVWYATGQMPQIRDVMSGGSVCCRPRRNASKKRGGS
jgi:hypothetical protein